jgi:hypothetical protein
MNDTREKLAAYAHEAWSSWMKYMFSKSIQNLDGSITIPAPLVERWSFQMNTPYDQLPENMKPSDRDEADKMLKIVNSQE